MGSLSMIRFRWSYLILLDEDSGLFLVLTVASVFTREQSPSCGPPTGPDFVPFGHRHLRFSLLAFSAT